MKDAAQSLAVSAQQLDHVVVRVAHVNDAWQIALTRKLEMSAKNLTLHIARREHAKIVQAKLADGHDLRLICQLAVAHANLVAIGAGIMRMRSDAREDYARMRLRQR